VSRLAESQAVLNGRSRCFPEPSQYLMGVRNAKILMRGVRGGIDMFVNVTNKIEAEWLGVYIKRDS